MNYNLLEKYASAASILIIENDFTFSQEMYFLLKDFSLNINIQKNEINGLNEYIKYFQINSEHYDLIIINIKISNMNGINFIKKIYKINPLQKVVVLSDYDDSKYLIELLNIGIEKFILKPTGSKIFLYEIYEILKKIFHNKYELNETKHIDFVHLSYGLIWNKKLKQLSFNDEILRLTKKEFLLLELLLKVPEKIYTYEEVSYHLWQNSLSIQAGSSNQKNLISRLKRKIPDLNIENIYGIGYRLNIINDK